MSNIDKEWLQQKIADMEAARDEIPFGLDEDDNNTLAAMKLALASLEAEHAGWQVKKHGGNWVSIKEEDVDHYRFNEDLPVREVYTAPPAPVSVPDIATVETTYPDVQTNWQDAKMYAEGWNACRAAMLQGAEPASQPYTLPEGMVIVPVEPTREMRLQIHPIAEVTCMECGRSVTADCEDNVLLSWADMIAAAPQQEVESQIRKGKTVAREEWELGARLTKHRFKP